MEPHIKEPLRNARNHILAAMGEIAKAMVAEDRLRTTPGHLLINELNRSVDLLDSITAHL